MIKIGTVTKHELELVNRLVHHCEPPEHHARGVLLTTKNGKRVWQVGALTTNMTVVGQDADFDGSYIVFGRFIQAAYSQCGFNSSCELTIDNNEITATVDGMQVMSYSTMGVAGNICISGRWQRCKTQGHHCWHKPDK